MPPARRMMLTEELVAKTLRTEVDPGPDADEVLLGDDAFVTEAARLEALCDEVEGLFPSREPRELRTREIGAHLMERLKEVDQVAFVRFASVYRRFEDAGDFVEEVETLLSDARAPARRSR